MNNLTGLELNEVINDRIYFCGWTIPLIYEIVQSTAHDMKKYIMATLLLK